MTGALETAFDKLTHLPRAMAAGVQGAAAAAAEALHLSRDPRSGATSGGGGGTSDRGAAEVRRRRSLGGGRPLRRSRSHSRSRSRGRSPLVGPLATVAEGSCKPEADSFLSSDMGTPHGTLPEPPGVAAGALATGAGALLAALGIGGSAAAAASSASAFNPGACAPGGCGAGGSGDSGAEMQRAPSPRRHDRSHVHGGDAGPHHLGRSHSPQARLPKAPPVGRPAMAALAQRVRGGLWFPPDPMKSSSGESVRRCTSIKRPGA